ncbi:MAG: 2,3-diphosphoglycerate-dependent phosphoglycerate mutase [Bacillota bacterium]|jgi:2,3-bisphosphoglycerate-dependent phosphoglycerate mutase
MKLVLLRHGESEWNLKNLFTGWTDVGLTEAGVAEAQAAGVILRGQQYDFDLCYTSYLRRAIQTLNIVLKELDREWLPVIKAWQLNERHYGALQGLNKAEMAQKYGTEQVKIWRRSFAVRPPELSGTDPRNPRLQSQYRNEKSEALPLGESLADTVARVIPYFNDLIKPEMNRGRRVVISAHGNSLRALVKYFERLSEQDIMEVNIPTGVPLVYEFDTMWEVVGKEYLGDRDLIQAKIESVAKQGMVKT